MPRELRRGFDEVPDLYDRIRPRHPAAFFDRVFDELVPSPSLLEVGPGPGIATADLLRRGATVTAVEIGPQLAAALGRRLCGDGLEIIVGAVEEVDLAGRRFQGLVSACAYHWVDPGARTDLPARVLDDNGLVALIDLVQVDATEDRGFFDRAQVVYERFGRARTADTPGPPVPDMAAPAALEDFRHDGRFSDPEVTRVRWDQTYSTSDYCDLLRTYSPMLAMDPADRERMITEVADLIDGEFDGSVTRPLVSFLTTCRLVDR